ncbi:uncharacterized protein [Dermacentor albipictus]|uniref:uncharacterized protein isoform X1 n=1 Tax=Dermacentor albipictus TaxID=60249 RepID=UPI0038FD22F4
MNDISEARKCDSTLSQRKSRTLSAPTTPTGPAEMRSGGPVEKSQATAVAVPSKRSMQTSSRSTTQVTSKVTPKSQDSQVPVKMNDGRDIVAVASARTEIVGKSVEAPAANADEVDKAVNAGTMVGETSVVDTALQLICPGPQGTAASKYNASAQCLHRLHYRLGLQRHTIGSGKVQRHAMYLQAFSLRLAYEGLLASFGQEALTDESRMLWPEAQKTFFMRFCLLSCNSDQKPNPLSPRAGCLLPLHAMPEFTPRRCTQCTPNSYQARSPVCVAIMRTSNMASGAAPLPVLLSPKRI